MNMRTFEIPPARGFVLVNDVPGLEKLFIVEEDIVAYQSPEHFREMVDYYLAHPVESETIIERGRARVLRGHTYQQRLTIILETLRQV